jgi:2-oxoglutarate dehydrogenase E2 component (dihydrolipoamide succinyltransferase)
MIIEVKIPSPGESVTEVEIASWLVSDGDFVEKDQEIAEVESDKATLPLMAEESGTIKIIEETGKTIRVGAVACTIDTSASAPDLPDTGEAAGAESTDGSEQDAPAAVEDPHKTGDKAEKIIPVNTENPSLYDKVKISPLAKRLMEEKGFTIDDVIKGLQRITREDVSALERTMDQEPQTRDENLPSRDSGREKMSMLRRNLSKRLVAVKNETAMLTTFNEVDMSEIIAIRKKYQTKFTETHGVKLGFMSFFVKASTEALKLYPKVNSFLDGEDVVSPRYCDIGIAVQTDKGLLVPVIRNTETLGLAGIEKRIGEMAEKARKNRISIEELTGGTFTITNGGIFGSLLSTPIINPPQSGILGMHNITERPMAVNGKVEIRPMMFIALSYDHRLIDGRDSVGFLVSVKGMLENPSSLLSADADPVSLLLEI